MLGAILWAGPSQFDGAPIMLVASALRGSRNGKTGNVAQLYIMRADVHPAIASQRGRDSSVCGTCPHQGRMVDGERVERSCYVNLWRGPASVWRSVQAGLYPALDSEVGAHVLAGRVVRIGAYGDPAALPPGVLDELLVGALAVTGYSHAWRERPDLRRWCMASADSSAERAEARAAGWRVFRVRGAAEPVEAREIACPASAEAGKKTTCASCRACGGLSSRARVDVAIVAHGVGRHAFERARARAA